MINNLSIYLLNVYILLSGKVVWPLNPLLDETLVEKEVVKNQYFFRKMRKHKTKFLKTLNRMRVDQK